MCVCVCVYMYDEMVCLLPKLLCYKKKCLVTDFNPTHKSDSSPFPESSSESLLRRRQWFLLFTFLNTTFGAAVAVLASVSLDMILKVQKYRIYQSNKIKNSHHLEHHY